MLLFHNYELFITYMLLVELGGNFLIKFYCIYFLCIQIFKCNLCLFYTLVTFLFPEPLKESILEDIKGI